MTRKSRVATNLQNQQTNPDTNATNSKNEDSNSFSSSNKSIQKRTKTNKFRKSTLKKKEEPPVPQPFIIPKNEEELKREADEQHVKELDQPLRTQLYIRETAKKRLAEKLAFQLSSKIRKKQPFDPNIETSSDFMKFVNVEKLAKIPYAVPQAVVQDKYHSENLFEQLKARKKQKSTAITEHDLQPKRYLTT